jgi:hypothetical protein
MPRKVIHDLCTCGNKKQIKSKLCKRCSSKQQSQTFLANRKNTICPQCNTRKMHRSAKTCKNCLLDNKRTKIFDNNTPIKHYLYRNNKNPNYFSRIRSHATNLVKHLNLSSDCIVCGFEHTDICHIKPIASFPDETPINVVNSPSNLVILCKNCHWLFDHGYDSIEAIRNYYLD